MLLISGRSTVIQVFKRPKAASKTIKVQLMVISVFKFFKKFKYLFIMNFKELLFWRA